VALEPLDDVLEKEEQMSIVATYLSYARQAFADRGLLYPFAEGPIGGTLVARRGLEKEATQCADLARIPRLGGRTAKEFELRAVRALHRMIGGWAACVGHPRQGQTGPKRAVEQFRTLIPNEVGSEHAVYSRAGDFGLDAVWILGREWGGPII